MVNCQPRSTHGLNLLLPIIAPLSIFVKFERCNFLAASRDAAGQKFLTRGSGRVIGGPLGSGRVG